MIEQVSIRKSLQHTACVFQEELAKYKILFDFVADEKLNEICCQSESQEIPEEQVEDEFITKYIIFRELCEELGIEIEYP